jgi:O-antigen/teichoic acid export membrane protein
MSHDFHDKLLAAEPFDADRAERLEREIATMWCGKLTRGRRVYWSMSLVGTLVFSVTGCFVLALTRMDSIFAVIWGILTIANAAAAVYLGMMLRRGAMDIRTFVSLGKIAPALSLAIVLLLVIRCIDAPSLEGLAWALFGIVLLVLSVAIVIWNRILHAEAATREQILRLQLVLMERDKRNEADAD